MANEQLASSAATPPCSLPAGEEVVGSEHGASRGSGSPSGTRLGPALSPVVVLGLQLKFPLSEVDGFIFQLQTCCVILNVSRVSSFFFFSLFF